jgi:hypothetical protein
MLALGGVLNLVAVLLLTFSGIPGSAQSQAYGGTHSPHGNLNIPCQNCHTANGWKPIRAVPEFDHNQTRYPLRGMHQAVACTQCHVKQVFTNVGLRCQDCHADIHKRQLGANCEQCHTVRGWTVSIQQVQQHNNRFPLTGAHAAVDCDSCHKGAANSKFQTMSTDCYSCHAADYKATTNPNHAASQFSITCEGCHGTDNWLNAKFDHSSVGFPLSGGHSVPPRQCADCHVNNNYNLTSTACVSCHIKDFQNTINPNHVQGGFAQTCELCHSTTAWQPATFDHSKSGFPLTGSHTVPPRQCADCHVNNNYNITATTCITCHQNDYNTATTPVPHTGFPTTCENCHDTLHWTDGKFDHSATGFPLTGLHTVPPRQCIDCHVNNNYALNSAACVSCHLKDFQGTTNPNHVTSNFPQTCEQCHSTTTWLNATFNHDSTGFSLTGLHMVPPRQCTDCHVNNNYNLSSAACVSCHLKDFQGTTNPNHVTANFPQTCDSCHSTTTWLNATFNHDSTGFPLTGLHTVPPRQCTDFHINNNYNLSSTACVTCHLKDFQGTTNPNHVTANFPQTCEQCHSTTTWLNATFNHDSTGFPLTGNHTVPPRQCTDCHVNNNYTLTTTTCISCHQTDYNNATTPVPHSGFPTTCENCHDTVLWTDGKFDHSTTGFPLTGMHTVPPRLCTDCHINNNYTLNSTACVTCHLKDFQGTTNPNHVSAGFPQQCELCHDTTVWTDSTFDHSNTTFPLTGSHMVPPRQCTDCHVNNNYTTLPITCIGCHQTDYNNTTNPGHAAQAQFFPTTCQSCHSTTNWLNASFNHTQYTQFPTNHGNANNVCATCHLNSNDYSVFQCTGCHGGNNSNNFQHDHVSGYVYNSINCYQCHANGQGGG